MRLTAEQAILVSEELSAEVKELQSDRKFHFCYSDCSAKTSVYCEHFKQYCYDAKQARTYVCVPCFMGDQQ